MEGLERKSAFTPEICSERIREHKPLLDELEKCSIDIEKISSLFSYALSENERWNEVSVQKEKLIGQSKDARKKVRKRHESKPTEWHRDKMLHAYTEAAARRIFLRELISRRTRTKTRPYIQELAFLLYYVISQKTKRPYRLMAGLFHIFPELLDIGCRRGCPLYDKAQGTCRLSHNIFHCRKHQTMRHSIWRITIAAIKSYPPDMLTRLTLSEKESD
jgi:hypothetical protein